MQVEKDDDNDDGDATNNSAVWVEFDPLSKDTGTASSSTAAGATASNEDLIALDIDVAEALASSTALIGRARRRSKKLKGAVDRADKSLEKDRKKEMKRRAVRKLGAVNIPRLKPPTRQLQQQKER